MFSSCSTAEVWQHFWDFSHLHIHWKPLLSFPTRSPSYKSFLPRSTQERIQEYNVLTRKRIRCRFMRFIQRFSDCRATVCNLKLKYLMSLETLLPSLYLERFQVSDLSGGQVTIVVTGNKGIQWSRARKEDGEKEKEEEEVSEVRMK